MNLGPYVESIQQQLAAAADAGDEETRALAGRLAGPLEAAARLALQDALAAAVEEITCELAPGAVELRLRGRNPEFVVTLPATDAAGELEQTPAPPRVWADGESLARINVRLPEQLKAHVEAAAAEAGLSVNAWLVRAAASAVEAEATGTRERRAPRGARRYTGWAR